MKKILCKLGFHSFRYEKRYVLTEKIVCKNCGKVIITGV